MDYEMDIDLDVIYDVHVCSGTMQPYRYVQSTEIKELWRLQRSYFTVITLESEGAICGEHIPDVQQWYGSFLILTVYENCEKLIIFFIMTFNREWHWSRITW